MNYLLLWLKQIFSTSIHATYRTHAASRNEICSKKTKKKARFAVHHQSFAAHLPAQIFKVSIMLLEGSLWDFTVDCTRFLKELLKRKKNAVKHLLEEKQTNKATTKKTTHAPEPKAAKAPKQQVFFQYLHSISVTKKIPALTAGMFLTCACRKRSSSELILTHTFAPCCPQSM